MSCAGNAHHSMMLTVKPVFDMQGPDNAVHVGCHAVGSQAYMIIDTAQCTEDSVQSCFALPAASL